MAPRSRSHLCFTIVEGSNRRREEGDVSRGFRVARATDWQGPIGFFVASPFLTWRRTHFPSTLNSCRVAGRAFLFSPVIIIKIRDFILMRGPGKAIRNCHENSQFSYT